MEQKIDRLAIAVKEGFDGVDAQFKSVDAQFKSVDAQFKSVASMAEVEGLRKELKADLAQMASKADLRRIEATMVTKDYLDDKLADLKGDLIVKLRKTNEKLDFIVSLLRAHAVFSDDDLKRIRTEFQIFPQLQ